MITKEAIKIITDHCEQCVDLDCDEYLIAIWCERLINAKLGMNIPWQEIHKVVNAWWKAEIEVPPFPS